LGRFSTHGHEAVSCVAMGVFGVIPTFHAPTVNTFFSPSFLFLTRHMSHEWWTPPLTGIRHGSIEAADGAVIRLGSGRKVLPLVPQQPVDIGRGEGDPRTGKLLPDVLA